MLNQSPQGRWIEEVEGNPGDIITRGEQITSLGQKMRECADTLEDIKNNDFADGIQKGKAVDQLKESVGDSHGVLLEASELYEPVGPVITAYGTALETLQPRINGHASDCDTKWATYIGLPGDAEGSTTPVADGGTFGLGGHDADSPEAQQEADENAAKKAAYDDWHDSAEAFDAAYDSWEQAFDEAADGVEDKMSGSIKDGWWDNISSFVNVVGTILSIAALVVGVIAIFATGFILLAAILAIASFLVVVVQAAAGEKSGWDVAIAAMGIIPVGKLSNLVKLAQAPKLLKGGSTVANAARRTWAAVRSGPIDDIVKLTPKSFKIGLKPGKQIVEGLLGPSLQTARKPLIKMYVGNRAALEANLQYVRNSARINQILGITSTQMGNYGRVDTTSGYFGGNLYTIPPILGRLIG